MVKVGAHTSFHELANAYADGAGALLMPATAQRSLSIRSYAELATEAQKLLAIGDEFAAAAASRVTSGSHEECTGAQLQLIAKSLTDLAISQHLLDAAEDEHNGITAQVASLSRSAALFEVNTYLHVVRSAKLPRPHMQALQLRNAPDASSARNELLETVDHTLATVLDKSAMHGQAAFRGLVGLGLFNLGKAATIALQPLGSILGYSEGEIANLYQLADQYIVQAHQTILDLLGRGLTQLAVDKAMGFFETLRDGSLLGDLLERLYETQRTRQDIAALVTDSDAGVDSLTQAIKQINQLNADFEDIMEFVGKLISGLKYVGMIPSVAIPQAMLVMAASHAVLFTYIVLAGADYADSQRIKMLNRVPGVRDLVAAAIHSKG
jgi:hypothetical protein